MFKNTTESKIKLSLTGLNNLTDEELIKYVLDLSLKDININTCKNIIIDNNTYTIANNNNNSIFKYNNNNPKQKINISRRRKEQKLLQSQNIKLVKTIKETDKPYNVTFK